MKIYFKKWLESSDSSKEIILNYLKDKLHISNEKEILELKIKDIDSKIVNDLISRGIIQSTPENIQAEIKNGDITIQELINKINS